MNILQDIKTAATVFGKVREARKNGADAVQIKPVYIVPAFKPTYWTGTMEACLVRGGETEKAVRDVFYLLPEETQHSLTFSPKKSGEWVKRARFWQQQLKPALPPKTYHDVMILFIEWYIYCLRMKKESTT